MHHEDGRRREKFENVVAVADGIHAVDVDALKVQLFRDKRTIDRQRRPRERPRTERHDIRSRIDALESLKIACKHSKIRHEMMRKENRLRTLEMRIAGHNDFTVTLRRFHKCFLQLPNVIQYLDDRAAHKHMRIERDLIVAAARGVQTAARVADRVRETFLDIHVNILERRAELECPRVDLRENVTQPLFNGRVIRRGDDADMREHGGMGDRPRDVLAVHAAVKADGRLKFVDHLVRRLGKASAPELFTHLPCASCMSARTLSGSPKRLMNPVASA